MSRKRVKVSSNVRFLAYGGHPPRKLKDGVRPILNIPWKLALWLVWMTWMRRAGISLREIAETIAQARVTLGGKPFQPSHETIRQYLAYAERLFFTLPQSELMLNLVRLNPPPGKSLMTWTPKIWGKDWFADYLENQTLDGPIAEAIRIQLTLDPNYEREEQERRSREEEAIRAERQRRFKGKTRLQKEIANEVKAPGVHDKYQGLRGPRKRK